MGHHFYFLTKILESIGLVDFAHHYQHVVHTWFVMALLILAALLFARGVQMLPRKGQNFFEVLWYQFRFGRDGYLVYDTKDFRIADELGEQDGALQVLREQLMEPAEDGGPSRWSIGVSHRGGRAQGMRSQFVLFVDNPLDFLVGGHTHRDSRPGQKVSWGTTPVLVTAAAKNGAVRLVHVGPNGITPQPTTYAIDLRMTRRRGPSYKK